MATCPECEALLDIDEDEVEEGDVMNCAECGLELEVIHRSPLEVERMDEEDDEDEEGGYDEDDDDADDAADDDDDDDDDDDKDDDE